MEMVSKDVGPKMTMWKVSLSLTYWYAYTHLEIVICIVG